MGWGLRRAALRQTGSRLFAIGLLASGGAFAVAALVAEQGCAKEASKPSAAEPIVIGVSLGLTKDLATLSAPLRDAVHSAEGEINANGGLLGRPVRFDVVDDQSDEADGVIKVAQDLVGRRVTAMIGPVSSGQVKATHQIFADKKILQIAPAAMSVELNDIEPSGDRFLFRTAPADDLQGAAVILFATKTPLGLGDAGAPLDDAGAPVTCNRLALVYIDNPYGLSMAKVITDNFPKRGAGRSIVSDRKIALAAPSYADDAAAIIAADPECLALISNERAGAQFVKDVKAHPGYPALAAKNFFFIGTDGVFSQGFLDLSRADPANDTSPSSAEGVYGTNFDTQPGTPPYQAFRTIFSSYFPLKPLDEAPAFAANAFDAAVLVAFAIQRAGDVNNGVAIRDALRDVASPGGRPISPAEISDGLSELRAGRDIDYQGASGDVNFAPNGSVTSGFAVWQAVRDPQNKVVYKTIAHFDPVSLQEQVK